MTDATKKLFREAMRLTAAERAVLVEELLSSLDRPDAALDDLWAKEAEDRLSAFRAGEAEAVPAESVFQELGKN
jgi:putative addiction module component (TIGR02574 family)